MQQTANPLRTRILQRLAPGVYTLLFVLIVISTIVVIRGYQETLHLQYSAALDDMTDVLKTDMERYVNSLRNLATDDALRNVANFTSPDVNIASAGARNLIRNNPRDFLAVRYLRADGQLLIEVVNNNGVPIISDPSVISENKVNYDIAVIQQIVNGNQQVHLGRVREIRDENGRSYSPPRAALAAYVAVYSTAGRLDGILQLEFNATTLFDIAQRNANDYIALENGRQVVLLDEENRILADSSVNNAVFLTELNAVGGNAGGSEIYEQLVEQSNEESYGIGVIVGGLVINGFDVGFTNIAEIDWHLFIVDSVASAYSPLVLQVILRLVVLVSIVGVLYWALTRLLDQELATQVIVDNRIQQIAQGQFSAEAQPTAPTQRETPLITDVERIGEQLQNLSQRLTSEVRRRNRDVQIAGRIGRETATLTDLDVLVPRAINLICNELGFYHAQVFLVDETKTVAVLRYSRGEAGQKMIERGHQIRIGTATVVGTVTSEKRPVIVNDTFAEEHDGKHGFNPLLPNTRAEMGLPLLIGDQAIGALDIQSREPNVFQPEDIATYQLLADQLAIAIHHAQLQTQTEYRIQQIDRLNRQLTRQAWQASDAPMQLGESFGHTEETQLNPSIAAPISIRGEVIGTLEAVIPDGDFTVGDQMVLQAVAERVSLAIENARLFQETQGSLAETSTLYRLSRLLNEANTLEDVLHSVITSVVPDASGGQIWLFEERLPSEQPHLMTRVAALEHNMPLKADSALPFLHIQEYDFLRQVSHDVVTLMPNLPEQSGYTPDLQNQFGKTTQALAVIPLNMRGVSKGLMILLFDKPRQFASREERIYEALVGQAGVAIDNRLLLRQTEEALSRNEKLYSASRLINTAQNLEDLVYAAVATTNAHHLNFWLAMLEGEEDEAGWRRQARLIARSSMGMVERADQLFPVYLPANSPMRRREPEVFHADDPNLEVQTRLKSLGLRFMATFPLFTDNQPTALFFIVSAEDHELTNDDFEVYKALTGQMSIQIQNRRLLEQTAAALNETRRLYVAGNAISAAPDLDGIYHALAMHLTTPFQASNAQLSVTLFLARPEPTPDAAFIEYAYQWFSSDEIELGTAPKVGELVAHEEAPFARLAEDTDNEVLIFQTLDNPAYPSRLRGILQQGDAQSAVATSLRSGQRWYGVVVCRSSQVQAFDENFGRFMQALSSQVALAIERQQLFAAAEAERANLNSILATLPAGVLVLDPETFIPIQTNDRVTELLGQAVDFTAPFSSARYNLYRTGTNLFYPDNELPIYTARQLNRPMFSDDVAVILGEYQTDLLVNAAPIYDNRGEVLALVTAFQDISNLRSLENTLQENLRETVSLYETQRALSQSETLEDLLDNILAQLAMQQPDDAHIIMTDVVDNTPYIARSLIDPLESPSLVAPLLDSNLQHLSDVDSAADIDATLRQNLLGRGIASLLILPLQAKTRNRPLGWLLLTAVLPEAFNEDRLRVLTTLTDMATTAVDNSYLVRSTQAAYQEVTALYNAASSISRSRDLTALSAALENALGSLNADLYAGYLRLKSEKETHPRTTPLFKVNFDDSEDKGLHPEFLVMCDIEAPDNFYEAQLSSDTPGEFELELLQDPRIQSFAAVNISVKDTVGGRLLVGYFNEHRFTEGERRFLNTISDNAGVVIDNQTLLEQIRSTLQETSVLYQASRALIEVNTPEDIIKVIADYLAEPHINQVFIAMLNTTAWHNANATVQIVATWQSDTDINLKDVTLGPDQFPAWAQLSSEQVLIINDIYDPIYELTALQQTSIESLDTRSLVIIPLRVPSRAIGAIWLGSREPYTYEDRHLRTFQAFAEQTSLSLEAARLLGQTERRATQLETSAVISQSIGNILELDVLLPQVVELIRDQFKYDHVQVFLMDENHDFALLRASTGDAGQQLLSIGHKLRKGSDSVIGRVTSTGRPALALDTSDANVVHQPNPYLPLTRSEIALPLIVKGEVVGALDVQSNQPNAFGVEDTQVLTTLAAQIAVAIENARLYVESQERAEEMTFLFDLTNTAAAAETLDEALHNVGRRIYETMNALALVMYLPQTYQDQIDQNTIVVMKAVTLIGLDYPLDEVTTVRRGDSENLIGIVSNSFQPEIIGDIKREVRYTPIAQAARSAILIPISTGQTLVGLLALESARPHAYDADTQTLLQAMAGSLAATIQNRQLLDKLAASVEELKELDRLKSQFLASMSHELRTPLNSIIGFSRVMLKGIDGPLTEMQEQDLTTIYNSGNHLLNLINDILDQAKIENNELNLKFSYFEVKPMIEGVKSIAVGLLKEKTLKLHVEIAPNLPPAYGDEFRSRQILLNLVSNAIKFTQEGSVTIRAYIAEDPNLERNVLRLDVIDSGIGISEKDLPMLFQRFRQVDSSLTRSVGGTGLGLAISKSLAELQGGTIIVQSEVNVGSTFSVIIPVSEGAEEEVQRRRDEQQRQRERDFSMDTAIIKRPKTGPIAVDTDLSDAQDKPPAPRPIPVTREMPALMNSKRDVLLIEDNKEIVDQFRRALQREGYEVQTADHPSYARAMAGQLRPSVIVMDVNFGGGQGWDILKDLKEADESFDIPVVVSTLSPDSERAYRLGAHTYLQRPVIPEALIEAVKKAETENRLDRILIIDDQPESIRLLKQLLDKHGKYRVFSAENGRDGIALVARRRPDIIILDLRMPEMDGFNVLHELRSNPETAQIPIVIVTGETNFNVTEQAQLQNFLVLPKAGISQDEFDLFIDSIKQHLKRSGGS